MDNKATAILFVHGIQESPAQFQWMIDQLPPRIRYENVPWGKCRSVSTCRKERMAGSGEWYGDKAMPSSIGVFSLLATRWGVYWEWKQPSFPACIFPVCFCLPVPWACGLHLHISEIICWLYRIIMGETRMSFRSKKQTVSLQNMLEIICSACILIWI